MNLKSNSISLDLNRRKLNKLPRKVFGYEQLTDLNVRVNRFTDCSFAEIFSRLKTLNASFNQIQNTEGLIGLHKLENLDITHNSIKHLNDISELYRLHTLRCGFNPISDEKPLLNLNSLKIIDIQYTKILNFDFLQTFHALEFLNVCNCFSYDNPVFKTLKNSV